jgi:hypothetical protein
MIIDTNTSCLHKSAFLKTKGVTAVGRYYRVVHPEWAITKPEAQELSTAQIKIFVVYEDTGKAKDFHLTKVQGQTDGTNALNQARNIGQPQGGVIYFAVEGLPDGYGSANLSAIEDYFAGVEASIGTNYQLGVYGDGIVCKTLLDKGICTHTWLAASLGFEGSKDFHASGRWNLFQTTPLDQTNGWDGLSVDVNEAKNDFGGFFV